MSKNWLGNESKQIMEVSWVCRRLFKELEEKQVICLIGRKGTEIIQHGSGA
jgi:hypothetical protein